MPKLESFYEVDERQLRACNDTELQRLTELIQKKLTEKLAYLLFTGGHIHFPTPEESPLRRTYIHKAEFEFVKLSHRLPYKGLIVSIGVPDCGPDTPQEIAPPEPKPPCNCNQYSFCPFLCR